MSEWISTKDRLPKPYESVIVARVYKVGEPMRVEAGKLTDGGWWKVFGTNVKRIAYWMPMPEPPELEPDDEAAEPTHVGYDDSQLGREK